MRPCRPRRIHRADQHQRRPGDSRHSARRCRNRTAEDSIQNNSDDNSNWAQRSAASGSCRIDHSGRRGVRRQSPNHSRSCQVAAQHCHGRRERTDESGRHRDIDVCRTAGRQFETERSRGRRINCRARQPNRCKCVRGRRQPAQPHSGDKQSGRDRHHECNLARATEVRPDHSSPGRERDDRTGRAKGKQQPFCFVARRADPVHALNPLEGEVAVGERPDEPHDESHGEQHGHDDADDEHQPRALRQPAGDHDG